MNLLNAISNRDTQKPLFFLHDEQIDVTTILKTQRDYSGLLEAAAGKSIALCLRHVSALAKCIILLDGVCPQIMLMPREANLDVMKHLLVSGNVKTVISDYLTVDDCPLPILAFTTSYGNVPSYKYETKWLLPTSGTTGTPKLIPHTISSLSRTVKRDNVKGLSLCWGTLYDIGRFAGLQVFLQAVLGGASLALLDNFDMPLPDLVSNLHKAEVNALSATPTMWQKILMTSGSERLKLKQITLGGEIVTQRVLEALSARYPDARITHIYASTEFGVGFSVTDRREGFPVEWLYGDQAIGSINADSGELLLRKGHVSFATGDAVEERGDRIVFRGRLNGSINVGGNKVMPEEVERILLQYPGIQMASVSAQRSSFMGNLVQAEIMAYFDCSQDEFRIGLMAHCRQHLDLYKVPAFIKFVDEVSTSSNGKILRNGRAA